MRHPMCAPHAVIVARSASVTALSGHVRRIRRLEFFGEAMTCVALPPGGTVPLTLTNVTSSSTQLGPTSPHPPVSASPTTRNPLTPNEMAAFMRRKAHGMPSAGHASASRGWRAMIERIGSSSVRPHRPEAQDVALSRPKHGFESRWGRQLPYNTSKQRSNGSLPRELVVSIQFRRERKLTDDEPAEDLLHLWHVS